MLAAFFIEHLFSPQGQLYFVSVVLTVILSITLHELAHGWAALWQGDDTPRTTGHMTADPLTHMGGMSLVALVLVGIAWGQMPVNPSRFRHRYGHALVAAAGPVMNLLLALVGLTALVLWVRTAGQPEETWQRNLQFFLLTFGQMNIALMLLNLIPVPPLDGATVLSELVPAFRRFLAGLQNPQMIFMILMMVMFVLAPSIFAVADSAVAAYLALWGPQ